MIRFIKILSGILLFISSYKGFCQVGINTTTPISTLDLNGNLSVKTIGITTPLLGGPSGGATLIDDGVYILKNITNFDTAKLYTAGGKRFFHKSSNVGSAIGAPIYLPPNSAGKSIIIISDGANWTYFD